MLSRVTSTLARGTRHALRTQKSFQPLQFVNTTPFITKRFYAAGGEESSSKDTVAVLLAGCGYLDGTEITEAVSTLIHLSEKGYRVVCFAPDGNQEETVDHATKAVDKNEIRNLVSESTRITRTPVLKLPMLKADQFKALIIPGGFGVAKTLSNYAENPNDFTVNKEVERVIREFHSLRKPIGVACIAPILTARVLGTKNGGPGCSVTLGNNDKQAEQSVEAVGSSHVPKEVDEVHIDTANKIVSTPAYQAKNPAPHEVYKGIGKMVEAVGRLAETGSAGKATAEDLNLGIFEEIGKKKYGDKWEELKKELA
jgi:enhancing lycopene biosynthesis protein 2